MECVARGYLSGSGHRRYRATGASGRRAAARAGRGLAAAGAGLHAVDEGGDRRARRGDRLRAGGRRRSVRRAPSELRDADARPLLAGGRDRRRRAGSCWPTRSSSSAWRGGVAGARRRGAHPGLVPLLAGGDLVARVGAAVVRQAVRPRLADVVRLGPRPPPPELPADVVEATRARYVTAYEQLTGERLSSDCDAPAAASPTSPAARATRAAAPARDGRHRAVWRRLIPLIPDSWRWAAPDLRGHGLSVAESPTASACTRPTWRRWPPSWARRRDGARPLFGGVIGAVLGSTVRVTVDRVVGLGVKIDWTDDEVSRAHAMSVRPAQVFGTAAEAAERHLKLAGLWDLVDPADPVARAGVRVSTAAGSPRWIRGPSLPSGRRSRRCSSRCAAPLRLAAGSATRWSGSTPCAGSIRRPWSSRAPATTPTGRPPRRSSPLLTP